MIYDSCECYSGEECCCRGDECERGNYYDKRDALARDFALTGLLRKVGDATPDDLILVYLHDTDLSGLSTYMFRKFDDPKDGDGTAYERSWLPTRKGDFSVHILKSVSNMAREYMVRCYWDHVNHIASRTGVMNGTFDDCDRNKVSFRTNRLYPFYVRQALDAMVVPIADSVELKDIKGAVDALYTTICPMATDRTGWRERDISKEGAEVLSLSNIRKLDSLTSILYKYTSNLSDLCQLPDPYCRETLFNLLDCLILICSTDNKFSETRRYKQIYEFSKLGNMFTGLKTNPLRNSQTYQIQDGWKGEVDTALQMYAHLSPEAAICVGNNVAMYEMSYVGRNSWYQQLRLVEFGDSGWYYPFTTYLSKINPVAVPEVALYMAKEVEFEKQKIKYLIKNKFVPSNGRMMCKGCYCGDVPAPVEVAG